MATTTETESLIDWHKGTWKPGARVRFYASKPEAFLDVFPGLYWYSGLGSGRLFLPDGKMLLDCSPSEGHAAAQEAGVEFHYVDSFAQCKHTFVGF